MKTNLSAFLITILLFTGCQSLKKIKGDGNLLTKEIHIPDYEK